MTYAQTSVLGILLIGLVSCGAQANSLAPYAPPSALHGLSLGIRPDGSDCGGSAGVKVRPCPAKLTKKRPTVYVRVSGPNVVNSAIKTNSKNQSGCGDVCEVGQYSSDPLKYDVAAGSKCGTAALSFYGYNQSGGTVGIGKLKVINKDC